MSSHISVKPKFHEGRASWELPTGVWELKNKPSDLTYTPKSTFLWMPSASQVTQIFPSIEVLKAVMGRDFLEALADDRQAAKIYFGPALIVFLRKAGAISKAGYAQYEQQFKADWRRDLSAMKLIHAEAELWYRAYECLESINFRGLWDFDWPGRHPSVVLYALIQERSLLGFLKGDMQGLKADQYLRDQRAINAQIRDDNPFPARSLTHFFIKICHQLLEQDDDVANFKGKYWLPLLKARMALTAIAGRSGGHLMDADTLRPLNTRALVAQKRGRGRPKGSKNK
jgi:hypothetical protein